MGLHQTPTAGGPRISSAGTPDAIVFVVEDDVSVRESLEALLAFEGWAVAGFDSAQAFLSHPRASTPGCLVLDVGLPDLDGLQLQQQLGADQQALPIIFVTGQADVPMTVRAMKAGAMEFLTKPLDNDALVGAVREALERSSSALAADAGLDILRKRCASLTPRERAVMTLVVAGRLNKQVGGDLGISEATVKAHRGQLMRKMQARSFADLVNMAGHLGVGKGGPA